MKLIITIFLFLLSLESLCCFHSNAIRSSKRRRKKSYPANTRNNWFNNGARIDNTVHQWMKDLGGDITINRLSIPGTHDTCSKDLTSSLGLSDYANTQSWALIDQLNSGIRYLDIRLNTKTQCIHGDYVSNVTFEDILKTINQFLKTNTDEAIIMRIQYKTKDFKNFITNFHTLLETYKDLFKRTTFIPKLSQIRGKIWPMFEIEGLNYEFDWIGNNLLVVQDDWYFYWNKYEKKKNSIADHFAITGQDRTKLYINHFSMSGIRGLDPTADTQNAAYVLNKVALDLFGFLGILVFDWPSEYLVKHVFYQNSVYPFPNQDYYIAFGSNSRECLEVATDPDGVGYGTCNTASQSFRFKQLVDKEKKFFTIFLNGKYLKGISTDQEKLFNFKYTTKKGLPVSINSKSYLWTLDPALDNGFKLKNEEYPNSKQLVWYFRKILN